MDRVERLTNLLALLLETPRPLTLVEIAGEMDGQYPTPKATLRAAFERDKAALREIGVPIETEVLSGDRAGESGYRVDRARFELADLDLEPDERRAIQLALAAVRSSSGSAMTAGEQALWKLGGAQRRRRTGGDGKRSGAAGPADASPRRGTAGGGRLHVPRSGAPGRPVRVDAARRLLVPARPRSRARRAAYVSRRPSQWRCADRRRRWRLRASGRIRSTRRVPDQRQTVRCGRRRQRRPPGCGSLPSGPPWWNARSAATASSPDGATGRSTSPCRPATRQRLRRGCSGSPTMRRCCPRKRSRERLCRPPAARSRRASPTAAEQAVSPAPRRSERAAESRLSRLLVILPWLMERGEVPLAEVAATFKMTPEEVAAELELAAMCGVPPFVDELIDVFIDGETVYVGVPRLFTKPLRLTAPEGFALVAAGRAAMQLPGADPTSALGRGLAKLAAALGEDADESALVVDLAATPMVDEFVDGGEAGRAASASDTGRRLATRPPSASSRRGGCSTSAASGTSPAMITGPASTAHSASIAWNRSSHTGEYDDPVDGTGLDSTGLQSSVAWSADGSLPRVTVRLQPAARWVVEEYPVDIVDRARRRRRRGPFRGRQRALARTAAAAGRHGRRGRRAGEVARSRTPRRQAPRCSATSDPAAGAALLGTKQVGEHRCRRRGVGEGVVMVGQRDAIASAQVGQSVGELAIGIELPGQVERAHPPVDHQWNLCSPSGALDELGIEVGVVGGEHAALEPSGELGERIACCRCRTQRSAGDAVDVARADAVPPAAGRTSVDQRSTTVPAASTVTTATCST